jgi:enediyne core biosynthesis thioesterase
VSGGPTADAHRLRHVVGFDETNLVGNVYYANYFTWQDRCRLSFIHELVPELVPQLRAGLAFVTLGCRINFADELFLFDEVDVRMSLTELVQNRLRLAFDYSRDGRPIARGEQELALMRREGTEPRPAPLPRELRAAFESIRAPAADAAEVALPAEDGRTEFADVPIYTYRHIVGFEETDETARVYHVNQIRWQGRARELVFGEYAPELVAELADGLALATVRCEWQRLGDVGAFDRVAVRMYSPRVVRNRMALEFEYLRLGPGGEEELVARGAQETASMRRTDDGSVPAPLPQALVPAMRRIAETRAGELDEHGLDPRLLVAAAERGTEAL